MNCSDWKKEYLTKGLLDAFTKVMGETEIPGYLLTERAWNEGEVIRLRYICEDKDIVLQEVYVQDMINTILADEEALDEKKAAEEAEKGYGWDDDCEEDWEEDEEELLNEIDLAFMIRDKWEKIYHFIFDNKEKIFQEDATRYLVPFLANNSLHENLINELPHVRKGSLSILFRLLIPGDPDLSTGILVTESMMKSWNIDEGQLLNKALYNPYFEEQYEILTFDEVFNGVKKQTESEWANMFEIKTPKMKGCFISSKGTYPYTAAAIFNERLCEELMPGIGDKYLIVLSCSGDVQVFPNSRDIEELQMDIEVENKCFGLVDGWISDSVFRYSQSHGLEEIRVSPKEIKGCERNIREEVTNRR